MKAHEALEDGQKTGRWLWCTDAGTPVGYCASSCNGHETPVGAERHYREWQIDQVYYFSVPEVRLHCVACGQWTNERAQLGGAVEGSGDILAMCLNHQNHGALRVHYAREKQKS